MSKSIPLVLPSPSASPVVRVAPHDEGGPAVGLLVPQVVLENTPHLEPGLELKAQGGLINRRYGGMIGNKSSGHNGNDIVAAGYTKIA